MEMYCLKCKQKTESTNVEYVTTVKNRKMVKSRCVVCNSKKSTFTK